MLCLCSGGKVPGINHTAGITGLYNVVLEGAADAKGIGRETYLENNRHKQQGTGFRGLFYMREPPNRHLGTE